MKIKYLIILLLISVNVWAGKDRGGGDAVEEARGWTLLDLAEKMDINYIQPITGIEQEQAFNVALENAYRCGVSIHIDAPGYHGLKFNLRDVLKQVAVGNSVPLTDVGLWAFAYHGLQQLVWIGTETPLEEISDEGVIRDVDPKTKKQVAIQLNGVVMVYMPIFRKMDYRSRAALVMHESLLRIVLSKFPHHYAKHGTSKIRKTVNLLFNPANYSIPTAEVQRVCGPQGELWK